MPDTELYSRLDPEKLAQIQDAERQPLRFRWWLILPAAVLLSSAQAVLNILFESRAKPAYLIATQISVIAFAFLLILAFVVNPLLRLTRAVRPLNRAEMMAIFAALFVSAGIASFGLADQLIPLIPAPFNRMWNIPQRRWDVDVIPYLNQSLYITDAKEIELFRQGFDSPEGLWHKIPWMLWAKPISLWLIFVFAIYMMFYGLSMLLYDSWARREKLVFPLARIPEAMMEEEGVAPGTLPATLRSALFWIGFLTVLLILSYNGACAAGWIRGVEPLNLGIEQNRLASMLENSIFRGIAAPLASSSLVLAIGFTAVGIGFLLPLEISASLWIYHLTGIGMLMVAIWCAVGASTKSFVSDVTWENHFVSSLGAGGLLAFSASYLAKLGYEKWGETRPRPAVPRAGGASSVADEGVQPGRWRRVADRSIPFIRSFGWGGLVFLLSAIIALAWLRWNGVGLSWGLGFMGIVILITVGLMRVVAEAGVYGFQIHTGPFHITRLVGGVPTVPASVLAPLMPIYSILFLDTKTFMAPSVINSFKMEEETRAPRRLFHMVVILSIIATVIVSLVGLLYITYLKGADRADNWFFTRGPSVLLSQAQRLVSGAFPGAGSLNWLFYILGACWVVLSILMRRRFFWWLHPIGFAMLANPLMSRLWLSFFIAWFCKKMAVKYGGRHMFAKLRPLFLGLIFGELVACFVWAVLAQLLQLRVSIDINL